MRLGVTALPNSSVSLSPGLLTHPTHGSTSLQTPPGPSSPPAAIPSPPAVVRRIPPLCVSGIMSCPRCDCGCCPSLPYHVFVQIPGTINCSNICRDVLVLPEW